MLSKGTPAIQGKNPRIRNAVCFISPPICQDSWVLVKAPVLVHSWWLLTVWKKAKALSHDGKG